MNAKRGRGPRMPEGLREAVWDRVVKMAAVAVLGLALSACGGGSPASAPAAQSSTSAQSAASTDGSSAPDQSTSTGTATSTGSSSAGASGSPGSGASSPPTTSTGNVTINWNAPTQNTDGSVLTDLAGFKIHYGTASGKYTQTITVSNPGLATYVVTDLAVGKYYFAVTAYSSAGTESAPSSEVSTTVN
jgi:Fibronectin type III domain